MTAELTPIIVADFETQLSGAISIGANSFTLQSVLDSDGNTLSNGTYCFTIDRDNLSRKEYLIGQLNAGTKTVSSISSVSTSGTLTSNAQKAHRIGANVIISDHSVLSVVSKVFRGTGTLDADTPLAYDANPTLSSSAQLATKGYVDSVVTGGTVNTDRIIVGSQTAGETISAGQVIYFKSADQRWWKADADDSATYAGLQLGIALGSGTAGNPIGTGVQIYGKCDSFSGLTAGSKYYLSSTAGGVSTTETAIEVGYAEDTDTIFINFGTTTTPTLFVSTSAGSADEDKGVILNSDGVLDNSFIQFRETLLYADNTAQSASAIGSTVAYTQDLSGAFDLNTGIKIKLGAKFSCEGSVSPGSPSVTVTVALEGTTLWTKTVGEAGGTSIADIEIILINQASLSSQVLYSHAVLPGFASMDTQETTKTIDTSGTPTLTVTMTNGHDSTRNIWNYYYLTVEKIA